MADVTPIIPLPPTPSEVQDAVQRMKIRMSETISSASRSSLHVSSLLRDKPHSLPPRFSSSMDSVNSSVKRLLDHKVNVITNDGLTYQGILKTYDLFLNLVLEECQEISSHQSRELGSFIINGDTICVLGAAIIEPEPPESYQFIPNPQSIVALDISDISDSENYNVSAEFSTQLSHRSFSDTQVHSDIVQMHSDIVQLRSPRTSALQMQTAIPFECESLESPLTTANCGQSSDNRVDSSPKMQAAPIPPSDNKPHFKRHVLSSSNPLAKTHVASECLDDAFEIHSSTAACSGPRDSVSKLHYVQANSDSIPGPSVSCVVSVEDQFCESPSTQSCQSSSIGQLHLMHLLVLQHNFKASSSPFQSITDVNTCGSPDSTSPDLSQPKLLKHNTLWSSTKIRTGFLLSLFFAVICCALDVLFDVLFVAESHQALSSSPFMQNFFPSTVAFLAIAFVITTYANFGFFRRFVLVSASEHRLESKCKTGLIWEELFPTISALFHTILFVSVGNACKSLVTQTASIYSWFFVKPVFVHSKITLSSCLVAGSLNVITSFFYLPKTIPAIFRSIASFCVLSQHDVCDKSTLFPNFVSFLNHKIVQSCASGVAVEFCDSTASKRNVDGYLMFLSKYVVRPIGLLFNFRTRINPEADVDFIDPLDSGYFERLSKWWNNYEEWQGSTFISYLMFVPFCILAFCLLLLQIVASFFTALFHMGAMLLQFLCLPILFPLGYSEGVFVSFCNSVKYMTGAIFIFSPKMPDFSFQTGSIDLKLYSSNCRGVRNMHELHFAAYEVTNVPYRFKIAFLFVGITFFATRFIILKLASFIICAFCWVFFFLFKLCLGFIQISSFLVSGLLGLSMLILQCAATFGYIIICPLLFLFAFALLIIWFLVSILALFAMELLCFISAMTNPEAGLIMFSNIAETRYKLLLVASFIETFPFLILQSYYSSLVGTGRIAGYCRIISVALSCWRFCILTSRIVLYLVAKFAGDKQTPLVTPCKFWERENIRLSNYHTVSANIMINFRSSLFPDRLSALLRIFCFAIFAGFFGWLGSQNLYNSQGYSTFMESNFPAPIVCESSTLFLICDLNARCSDNRCVCSDGFGGNGKSCIKSRPGICQNTISPCGYAATCEDTPSGYTCPCPLWTTAPEGGSAFYGNGNSSSQMCLCDSLSFPNVNFGKEACVTTLNLSQGEVAAIMIFVGYIPVVLIFLAHWKWSTREGKKYPGYWKVMFCCLLLGLVSVSLGLYLGGITSMMVFVMCIPIILCFAAHWNWKTKDGSKYPAKWKAAFAILFVVLLCLSLGFMLGNTVNTNWDKFRNQAAIMIFAVCVPIVLSFLLYWHYTTRGGAKVLSKKEKRRRMIIFFIVFIAIFALALGCILGVSTQPSFQAFDISAFDRKAGKIDASVILAFTPVNAVPSGGTITLEYPPSFFAQGVVPVITAGSSNVESLAGICGATTDTSLVITTLGGTIPAAAVVITIRGVVMGGLTAGAADITIQTSADTMKSSAIMSGGIYPPITDVYFDIALADRVSGKTDVKITVQFTPSNPIPSGGTITLFYPNSFFASSVKPNISAGSNYISGLSGVCGLTTSRSVIVSVIGARIPSAPVKVVLEGLIMGSITNGSAVQVATSSDVLPSSEVPSGGIFNQVTAIHFQIFASDRIASRPSVSVTLSFTPTTPVPVGGFITINYPVGFFATSVTPNITAGKSNLGSFTGSCGPTSVSSVVIHTAGATINTSTFIVTISGFVMGAVTSGGQITVQTSSDVLASEAVSSGFIKGQVLGLSLSIDASERFEGKTNVPVILSFTPTTPIPIGGTFTLAYPSGFFAPSVTPKILAGSSGVPGLTGTSSNTTAPFIVILTLGAAIPALPFTVTISGLTMGKVTAGSLCTVQTSQDVLPSVAVDSGSILGVSHFFVTSPSFAIGNSDRVAGKSPVSITIGFTPSTSLPPSSTITIRFPFDFLATSVTPIVAAGSSSVSALNATCSPTTSTSFVITTAGATIPTTAFTLTIGGITLGGVTPGAAELTFETSTDVIPSAALSSGPILGQLASVSFGIRLPNRLVGNFPVSVTISFIPSSVLPAGGTITLSYPLHFFSPSVLPTVTAGSTSVNDLVAFCSSTTNTNIVITTAGAPMFPSSAVTITISGFAMGAATSGGSVFLESSADTVPSLPVSSGSIFGQVKNASFVISSSERIAGRVGVPITIGFSPSTSLNPGGTITLTYPSAFFAFCTPTVGLSDVSISNLTLSCSTTTATSFVLTTSGATISAGAMVSLTISGLTMGGATSGSVGVYMQTSADTLSSTAVSSGGIFTHVTFVSLSISLSDRIAHRTSVPITFGFSSKTPLPVGGNITLNYPSDFFATGVSVAFNSSSVVGLVAVCSLTTATSFVLTTQAAVVPNSATVITVGGFTMGPVFSGAVGVTIQTSTDTASSEAVSSGFIVGKVSSASFVIQSTDRIARRTSVSVTVGFTPTTAIPIGGRITLNYPSGFFAPSVTPSAVAAGTSSVAQLTGTCTATTAVSVTITLASAPIPATAFVITIAGLQMGSVTASAFGVSIQTSSDTEPSAPVASGDIFGQVSSLSFTIASSHRIASKSGVAVTLSFTLSTPLPTGGTIILNYPLNFFGASNPTVQPGSSSSSGFAATCAITNSTSVIISLTGTAVAASLFAVTLSGFTMGNATAGAVGVSVQTSSDIVASAPVSSGSIASQVIAVSFVISTADRIAFKPSVPITLSFTPTTSLPPGATITLSYPNGFFSPFITPSIAAANSNVANFAASSGATTASSVIITTSGAAIPATAFVVTIRGFTMGAATSGLLGTVIVQTSADTAQSYPVASGEIFGQVTAVSFSITQADRVAGKSMVPLTIGFTPTTSLPIGGTITISYPPFFFAQSVTPTIGSDSSSVVGLTGTCSPTGNSSFVVTTSDAALPASACIITVKGLTMGNSTSGSNTVTMQTSVDTVPSIGVSSGSIGSQVSSMSFSIASLDRMAGKTSVPVTFGFTAAVSLNIGGAITLSYPSGFFASSITPTFTTGKSNVANLAGTCSSTGASFLVITITGAAIPAASAVTMTISGFKMGTITSGAVGVYVQTTVDVSPSLAVASGSIYGYRQYAIIVGDWVYSTVADVPVTVASASKTTQGDNVFLAVPLMWQIAPDNAESRNVIKTYPFSTDVVLMSNGVGIRTSQYFYQGLPGSQYCYTLPCPNYLLTDSQGRVAVADYNLQILIRRSK